MGSVPIQYYVVKKGGNRMGNENAVSEKRLSILIDAALENKGRLSKSKLFKDIGASMVSLGLEAETDPDSPYYLRPVSAVDFKTQSPIDAMELHFSVMSNPIAEDASEKKGSEFWEIFKNKAARQICGDEGIRKLIKDGKVKEALLLMLPPVLITMGLSALWIPAAAVIAAGLIMILTDTGIDSLCEMYKK